MPGEIRVTNTGTPLDGPFMAGSPVSPGKLNARCVIFPDCPFFKRKLQDEHLVLSSDTIGRAPDYLRYYLDWINGIDGVFLKQWHQYNHNLISAPRPDWTDKSDQERENDKAIQVLPASSLDFPNMPVLSAFDLFKKNEDGSIDIPFVTVGAQAAHQTWIDDGSLFINYTYTHSQLIEEPFNNTDEFKRFFYPVWGYFVHNAPKDVRDEVSNSGPLSSQARLLPFQTKAGTIGNPIADFLKKDPLIDDSQFTTSKSNVYKNINPGVHWRVMKRTPLFQGEDFWVEFRNMSFESSINLSPGDRFKTRPGYEFLDPYQQSVLDINGDILNEAPDTKYEDIPGILFTDANHVKNVTYELAGQRYLIVELGHLHPDHNYFLIISERNDPIFCHLGRPNFKSSDKIVSYKTPVLRRLSKYTVADGKTLLGDGLDALRITFRQHLGKLIITFGQYESNPWVISRTDILPKSTAYDGSQNIADFSEEDVPMIIPESKVVLMGGNIRTAFSFNTLRYEEMSNQYFDPKYIVAGPIKFKDINILLRDKGLSSNPNISSRPRKFEFSQEADVYTEMLKGKIVSTRGIKVQDLLIQKYGKAPFMQTHDDGDGSDFPKFDRSTIVAGAVNISDQKSKDKSTDDIQHDGPMLIGVYLGAKPGDYVFLDGVVTDGGDPWVLKGCITPIMTGLRVNVPADGEAFDSPAIDVSHHVMSITDTWNEDNLMKINHSGKIQFLINRGMNGFFADGRKNYSEYLTSLSDRNFYIQISVWWDEEGAIPTPNTDAGRIIFTGICTNASISEEVNKKIMTCDLVDYTKVLQDQVFLNSPFFDKMRDFNAIYEIIQKASFRDDSDLQPGSLMKNLAESDVSGWFQIPHNGELVFNQEYALPGAYTILQDPMFKFRDGSTLFEGIQKIAEISGKVIYFDRYGVFHYEKLPYDQALFNGQEGTSSTSSMYDWGSLSKLDFFTSPHDVSSFDGKEQHRMAWDSYTVTRDMDSVINHINVISNTPDGNLLQGGLMNPRSINDIESPGFIGYPKTLLQIEGIIGDKANVQWLIKHYTKLFLPPVKIHFKAIGHNGIKALDIVTFTGLGWAGKQVLIVGSVSSEINAETNQWWQEFECYWLFPSVELNPSNITVNTIGKDQLIGGGF